MQRCACRANSTIQRLANDAATSRSRHLSVCRRTVHCMSDDTPVPLEPAAAAPWKPAQFDALDVPEDAAGDHRAALTAILLRIPDGWGRWISCEAGWYSLIIDLDTDLVAIDPDYALHQCKQKFGGLRFYAHASEELAEEAHRRFDERIAAAERASLTTCETCSSTAGSLRQRRGWFKTLCESCAAKSGYRLPSDSDGS